MALNPVDQFLAGKPTYLSSMDRSIASSKEARRAAQKAARGPAAIARGRAAMPAMDPRFLNPQSVGATIPGATIPGQQAIGMGERGMVRTMAGGQVPPNATQAYAANQAANAAAGTSGSSSISGAAGSWKRPLGVGPGQPGGALAVPGRTVGAGLGRTPLAIGPGPVGPVQATYAKAAGGAADDIAGQALGAQARGAQARGAGSAATKLSGPGSAANATATSTAATKVGARGLLNGQGLSKLFSGVTRQGMMKGAGVAGTGYMLSGLVDGMDIGGENGVVDRAGSAGILGGGLAAGGAIALGIPQVAAAAAGGAILFGGYKALWGEKRTTPEQMADTSAEMRDTIESVGSMYGLEGTDMEDIMMQFDASTQIMIQQNDKAGMKAYMTGLTNQLPAMMLQQKSAADAKGEETNRYERMMQMQAQFAPMFERQMDTANQSSERAYQQQMSVSDVLTDRQPQLAQLVRSSAANDNAAQSRLMTAYARQVSLGPGQAADTSDLQRRIEQDQLLNQYLG
jgi:hypothetical protein